MLHLLINSELKFDRKLWSETQKIEIGPFLQSPVKVYQLYHCTAQYAIGEAFLIFINSFQSYRNQLLLMDFSQLTAVNAGAAVFNGRCLIQDVQLNTTLSFVMIIM